jgi:hypothetical protein
MINMGKLLRPITAEQFNIIRKTKFSNIEEGFERYPNGILDIHEQALTMEESEDTSYSVENYNLKHEEPFINFMKSVYNINKDEAVVIDFYLKDIDSIGILRILNYLDYKDKLILLDNLKNLDTKSIYFIVEEEALIPFITRLSTRELLFCTIHFNAMPITIWGNYKLAFPMFFKDYKDIELYKNIAKENNLFIRDVKLIKN